ncbi:hypothetical protein TNCT_432651 [Trichonephila clavata]|uniref:Uncharacterized protein n=1 Tax=Trichonephila clavata TaxID=2740835 RepID=A0A8X6JGB5_TRICU|nr:hypothetical protein TNCT_432651 [Trichonephila clavata]
MMIETVGKNQKKYNILKALEQKPILSSLFMHTTEKNSIVDVNTTFLERKWKYYLKNSLNANIIDGASQYYKSLKQGSKRNGGKGRMRPAKDCPMRIGRRKKSQTKMRPNQRKRNTRRESRPPIRLRKLAPRRKKKKKDDKRRSGIGVAM